MANLKTFILVTGLWGASLAVLSGAYVASSTNYQLLSDSINFGGGYSTSTAYGLQDTLGEIGSGIGSSTTYILSAGYQAMDTNIFIAVSSPDNVALSPTISGVSGGQSNGAAEWAVQTDNPAGYQLTIKAATAPALASGANTFADYVPSHSDPDFTWSTPTSESRFGFSAEGDNLATAFKDNGASCNAGASDAALSCWTGFALTDQVIAQSGSANYPNYSTTTVRFRAEVGSAKIQEQGTYQADLTVTATAL